MATTYEAIATVTVGSGGAANIEFTSIPATYTDLLVKLSARNVTNTEATGAIYFNNDTTNANYTARRILGDGASASSASTTNPYFFYMSFSTDTASTFANVEVYIPNYAGSNKKSVSADTVTENNATTAYAVLVAGLWDNTSAITSVKLQPYTAGAGNFAQYSSATLYGIKNS
jgi:hypothetical protein